MLTYVQESVGKTGEINGVQGQKMEEELLALIIGP
jgi:hypothetical protein